MISNVDKNVIMIKDIPSNMIEEAIFILKESVSDEMIDAKIELARAESELILQNYIEEEITDSLKKKTEILEEKRKKPKKLFCIALAVIFSILLNKL